MRVGAEETIRRSKHASRWSLPRRSISVRMDEENKKTWLSLA